MPWADVETLLVRIDRMLDAEHSDVLAPLRAPWRHLEHQQKGDEEIRKHQVARFRSDAESEARVRKDYRARFAIELLQNANDACAAAGVIGRTWFHVTDSALLVGNGGASFGPANIESLIHIGASTKEANRGRSTIGYKGIGFSSVFEISDNPQIISPPYQFGFHGDATAERIARSLGQEAGRVPSRGFPIPLEPLDWSEDSGAVDALFAKGAVTVIRLPFRDPAMGDQLRADIEATLVPEVLLFMPALSGLTLIGETDVVWDVEHLSDHSLGSIQRIAGPDTRDWLLVSDAADVDEAMTDALHDDMWQGVDSVSVAVAIPWGDNAPDPDRDFQPIHVYFPTDETLGRRFIIHGDFYVDSSRRHVDHQRGASAELNLALAESVANLVRRIVTSLADHGNALLRIISPDNSRTSGFGHVLGGLIDEGLRNSSFLRSADGGDLLRPERTQIVSTELEPEDEALLIRLVDDHSHVLRPGDRYRVQRYLETLGCKRLRAEDVAKTLKPGQTEVAPEEVLELLARWCGSRGAVDVAEALRGAPVVKDERGSWKAPKDVVRSSTGIPALPDAIRPATLAEPENEDLQSFAGTVLRISHLGARGAVDRLFRAIREEKFGRNDAERYETLRFLYQIWRFDSESVSEDDRHRGIQVPVAAATGNGEVSWRSACTTYFGSAFVTDSIPEAIYGPLGDEEFLSWDVPVEDRQTWRELFALLGVGVNPRMNELASESMDREWRKATYAADAWSCPSGHPRTKTKVVGTMVDRLDKVLKLGDPGAMRALCRYLAQDPKPFGGDTYIECLHSAHRSDPRPRGNKTIGYQRWLLEHNDWIPISGSDEAFGRPENVWYGIPERYAGALPSAAIDNDTAKSFGCVAWSRPRQKAIVAAFLRLADLYPDLAAAPDVVAQVAEYLANRMKVSESPGGEIWPNKVPLPARTRGELCWSTKPLIPDLPGLDDFSVALFVRKLRRVAAKKYNLQFASDVFDVQLRAKMIGATVEGIHYPISDPVGLVAVAVSMDRDIDIAAGRVHRLDQIACQSIELDLTLGADRNLRAYGHRIERTRQEPRSGRLHFIPDQIDYYAFASDVAEYVGLDPDDDNLVLFFIDHDRYLAHREIGVEQLDDAREALLRRGAAVENDHAVLADRPEIGGSSSLTETALESQSTVRSSSDEAGAAPTDMTSALRDEVSGGRARSDDDQARLTGASMPHSEMSPARCTSEGVPTGQNTVVGGLSQRNDDPSRVSSEDRSPAPNRSETSIGGIIEDTEREPINVAEVTFERIDRRPTMGGSLPSPPKQHSPSATGTVEGAAVPRGSSEARRRSEMDAVALFTRFAETEWGAIVHSVEDENKGWDLEVQVGSELRLVEVKGLAGAGNRIVLTRNELEQARTQDSYWIAIVDSLRDGRGEINLIRGEDLPGEDDNSATIRPLQWEFSGWRSIVSQQHYKWL